MQSCSEQMRHAVDDGVSARLVADDDNCEIGRRSPDNQSDSESGCDHSRSSRTGSRDDAERTEEELTYIKFVNSVFFDDDVCSRYSNPSDEDEDENYEPDCKEGNDDDEDDDDDDDDDLVRVQNRELRELVDGCWQTIAGEVPSVSLAAAATSTDGDPSRRALSEENRSLKHASIPIESEHNGPISDSDAICINDNRESEQQRQGWSVDTTTVDDNNTDKDDSAGHCSEDSSSNSNSCRTRTKHSVIPGIGQSAISHLVTKMFSDSEPVDVCVDGNPVQAVRQLVARQLSMAAQLLIQVLLQADDRSDSFTKAYTSLVELSNLRDAALRKATLVQMNVDNARTIKSNMAVSISEGDMKSSAYSYCEDDDDDCDQLLFCGDNRHAAAAATAVPSAPVAAISITSPPFHSSSSSSSSMVASDGVLSISAPHLERRLTRSSVALTGGQRPSHSVLDVPALSRIAQLFVLIDQSRKNIKHQQLQLQLQTLADPNSWMKSYSLSVIKQEVTVSVVPQMELRLWTCLLPSASYPLPHSLFASTDPGSLTGRCLFTPAEDDLLLRGASSTVDTTQSCQQAAAMPPSSSSSRWDSVRARLLPNKEAQLLQFRYSQMVSLSSAVRIEENHFRKFIRYEAEYGARDSKWTHLEELDLLRGFQLFGEKWPLIKMFFLPHRKAHQIRIRWQGLQKIWHKAYLGQSGPSSSSSSSSSSRPTYSTEDLSPDLAPFLREVNRAMLAKPSTSSTQPPEHQHHPPPHHSHHHLMTSARDSTDSGRCEETLAVGDDVHRSTSSGSCCDNRFLGSNYFMIDDGCYPTSISHTAVVSDSNSKESVAAPRGGVELALSGLDLSGPLLLKDLSGPLLLKDLPSNKYAKEKKNHKAFQRDVMRRTAVTGAAAAARDTTVAQSAISCSSRDEASWSTYEGVPELKTASSIDAQQKQKEQQQQQEEVDLGHSPDGVVPVGVVGDEAAGHSLSATADCGGGTHPAAAAAMELLMGDSDSLLSLLNGVDCLESMLRSCSSEHCLNGGGDAATTSVAVPENADHAGTTSSGYRQTMPEMMPSSSLGGSNLYSYLSAGAIVLEAGSTRIDGDQLLSLPSAGGDSILMPVQIPSSSPQTINKKKKKKTIKPTHIAATREELCCNMSPSFAENPPISQRISASSSSSSSSSVHWGSSPQIAAVSRPEPAAVIAGSGGGGGGGGDSGTEGLLPVRLTATASSAEGSKVVSSSAEGNSSCGWSLLDDASFLQREGSMWIDNCSEWTRFQERQAAASRCDQSSSSEGGGGGGGGGGPDPHLLLLHDISALEAPEGVVASSVENDGNHQRLLEDDGASQSGNNPSDDDDDGNSSLLFGAFMPDDLMASHSCFSNISKFVGFLKPDSVVNAVVGNVAIDLQPDNHRRARDDIEEEQQQQLLPQQKRQKKQKQQQLGIFAAVMASSKTSTSASRL